MYSYNYRTTITLPLNRETYIFESDNLDELCKKLNHFYLKNSGLQDLFNRDKLQNYISGRSRIPIYLRNVSIERN